MLQNLSDSVLAIIIPNGAHHIDLMFSDPVRAFTDPSSGVCGRG